MKRPALAVIALTAVVFSSGCSKGPPRPIYISVDKSGAISVSSGPAAPDAAVKPNPDGRHNSDASADGT
jgi:hypothetical protein